MTGAIIVYLKELKDILRDRRTIISMVLVPILFYPIITIGLGKVIVSQIEKTRRELQPVLVLPRNTDPDLVASLASQEGLRIVEPDSIRNRLLKEAESDSNMSAEVIRELFAGSPATIDDSTKKHIYYTATSREWIKAVVEIPERFLQRVAAGDSIAINILTDQEDVQSEAAGYHIKDWGISLRDSLVDVRLGSAGIDRRALKPFWLSTIDVAPPSKQSGRFLAMFLPYMLMILTFTGGLYPALDITAGEKERNTLETLLVAPVGRWELAMGKFLAVLTAGFVTMILATGSMTLSVKFGAMQFSGGETSAIPMGISPATIGWIFLLMVPMSMLFSALLITVAIAARSFKEAQSYTTPMLMAIILPAMITFIPGIRLKWSLVAVPVINLCLALKDILMGVQNPGMVLAVFAVTAVYAALTLFIAARIFQRESVLFRT